MQCHRSQQPTQNRKENIPKVWVLQRTTVPTAAVDLLPIRLRGVSQVDPYITGI